MKIITTLAGTMVCLLLLVGTSHAQQKRSSDQKQLLRAQYGDNYEEVLDKFGDDPEQLTKIQQNRISELFKPSPNDVFNSIYAAGLEDIGRMEVEPNNFFDTADAIDDVIALDGRRPEYTGKLIQASFTSGDVDVYKFTVDTTSMYYFAATHSFLSDGEDGLDVQMRLFHESDLDTTFTVNAGGIEGNDKLAGDIMGREADGRNGSGDFRLTGWVSPVDPATGQKLTGDFYLWVFNGSGEGGTYFMTAYEIPLEPYVSRAEPNYPFLSALQNPESVLPADGVVRTFMNFNPDTVKVVNPPVPVQGNNTFPQLWAQGDEDVDLYRIDYVANSVLTVETLPFFGQYRENDGTIGPGGTRLSDPRIRIYDADFTAIIAEDDDGAREQMDGPNNIHSRIVLTPEQLAEAGVTTDSPLWVWVSAWASQTRTRTDPGDGSGRNVDNSDPGRLMYDIYATQTSTDLAEAEPNNSTAEATQIGSRSDTTYTASFSDAADEDYYRIFMHEVRMYTLFTTGSTVSDDIQIEIYREYEADPTGTIALSDNLLTEPVAGNAGNNDFIVSGFVPEASGAYLIKLSSASAGDYQFGVVDKGQIYFGRIANEPDDTAPDALAQEAMQVGPGAQAESGMIFPAGDVDHYHFTVPEDTDLLLSIGGTHPDLVSDFAVQMTLLAPDGSEIGTTDTGLSHTTTVAGQYIVQVTAVNDGEEGFYSLSGGLPFEESESNDTFEDANQIALNNIYDATLTEGDTDFYQFNLKAGNLYSFRGLDNQTGSGLTVEFFDEVDGTTLLDDSGWPTNYSGDNFKIANIIPREDATYYLKISGSPGSYKLTSRVNEDYYALNHRGEPNNSIEEADAQGDYQALGADVQYVLSDITHPRFFGDEDWFRVSMVAGQTIVAETKPVGGDDWARDTDTRIVIWQVADSTIELANDDDGGNDWYSRAAYTASADGPVYVQVRTSRDTEGADDRSMNRGDYILNIDVTSAEIEPNNVFAEANDLRGGFIDAAFTETDDEVDVYALDLQADNIYHVRTLRPEEEGFSGAFNAKLFKASDTSTNLLDENNTGYNTRYSGSNVKLNIIPDESGVYYLELTGTGGSGQYQVGIKSNDISELQSAGEPNNTVEDADAIGTQEFDTPGAPRTFMLYNADYAWEAGDPISAQFSDDIDLYRYDLVTGDTLVAETSPVDGPLWPRDYDGFMRLLNAAGDTLDSNDDGGFDWHSRIQYVATEDGPVYVMVHGQDFGGPTDRDPSRGEYNLTVTKMDGSPIMIPVNNDDFETPYAFALDQNYPNPFNPTTTISYTIPEAINVELYVYNLLGQRVATLVNQVQTAGSHTVNFDASGLASGMYLYRIKAGKNVTVKKMLLVK